MDLLTALFTGVRRDLGLQRGRGRALIAPGDRGDAILISPQKTPSGYPDRAEFMVTISHHLLPWTAYLRDESLNEARARPLEYVHGVFHVRLESATGVPPGLWVVTPGTLDAVRSELGAALSRALTTTWLPLLSRAELSAVIRTRGGPGIPADRPAIDLMCRIEDLPSHDLCDLVRHFRSRGADRERLADWIERIFLSGGS